MRRLGRIQIFGKLKWPTLRPKLYRPGRDIVEQVAAEGRSSGENREQKEGRYELNQKDSKDRGPAVPSERGDRLLQHHLCAQQTDRFWERCCNRPQHSRFRS